MRGWFKNTKVTNGLVNVLNPLDYSSKKNCRVDSIVFDDCQDKKRGKISSTYFDVEPDKRVNSYSRDRDEI